jgi:predicted RecB family endonuclease
MNTAITTEEVQAGLNDLNVVYRAAMATLPTGLVPEAMAAQQKGLNESAQRLAELLEKVDKPAVTSDGPIEMMEPMKPAKK